MQQPIVGVMGPGEQATNQDCQYAYALGRQIAERGWILLTGGRHRGVMDAASRGAHSAQGLTIGILPGTDKQMMSPAVDIPILTGMGNARNLINVLTSDAIIVCGMGSGTASEAALALKTGKSIVLLNVDPISQQFFQQLSSQHVSVAETPEAAIEIVQHILDLNFQT